MTIDRETTRIVRSWLEEGVTALPDRVLDAVLDQLPATPQRRPSRPARRTRDMSTSFKVALAAAIVAVAFFGLSLPFLTLVQQPGSSPVVSPSSWLLEWMRAHGWPVPPSASVVQYLGESSALGREPARALDGVAPRRLAFFGQLREGKGIRIFLRALDRLDTQGRGEGTALR